MWRQSGQRQFDFKCGRDIAINGNVTAASVDMESALNFAGDTITFAAGPTIVQAAAQKYVASGNNADVNFNNALLQKSAGVQPDSFEWDQSASIGAPPALTLFGGGLVPGTYTLDSLNGNVTIPATYGVNLAGSILALKAPNGNIYIDDNLNLSSLSASGNTIDLNGTGGSETVTTSGGQTYNDPVVLTANATLSSSGGENITFDSTVDADLAANNRTLEVDTAGNEIFNGVVGGNQVLASLTTDGAGTVGGQAEFNMNLTLVPANVAGVNAGTVTINDGVLFNAADSILQGPTVRTTVGGQTYNGAATLGADTILADSAGKDITFNSTVDGAHRLTVDTVGNEIFNGVVGGTTALTSLTTDDPGAPETGTAGGQAEFNMNLTLVPANVAGVNAGTVTINDAVLFNAADSILQGPTVRTTVGGQTYNGAATLGADTILADSAGKDITFNSTVDGAHRLTVDTVGNEIFNGVVGGTTALTSLTTDNPGAPETGTAGGQAEFNMTAGTGVNNKAGVNAGTVTINDGAEIDVIGSTFATPERADQWRPDLQRGGGADGGHNYQQREQCDVWQHGGLASQQAVDFDGERAGRDVVRGQRGRGGQRAAWFFNHRRGGRDGFGQWRDSIGDDQGGYNGGSCDDGRTDLQRRGGAESRHDAHGAAI